MKKLNGLGNEKRLSDRICETIDFLMENAEKIGDNALKAELSFLKKDGIAQKYERLAEIADAAGRTFFTKV